MIIPFNEAKNYPYVLIGFVLLSILMLSCHTKEVNSELESIDFNKKYEWKMVTTWPPNFPVLGEGCNRYAELVEKLSGGRITIKVYGGGELVPPLEVFEAVNSGAAELGGGSPYYWAGKNPAFQYFSGVPFGMNAQQMTGWMHAGGGYDLWRKFYAKYNLVPFLAGNTGVQMGGWYNREINSIEDFKGLKMRMPGIGGKVLNAVGATTVLVPGGELYTSLERGVIDATEWIGPYHDYLMGFHKISKYYYAPGWHEPGTQLEIILNKREYDKLPVDLQNILQVAAEEVHTWTLASFESKSYEYLQKIKSETNVEIREFDQSILSALKLQTEKVLDELASENEDTKEIYNSYKAYHDNISQWSDYSEKLYYQKLSK